MNSKITILLIEDESSIRKLITKLLTSQNYKVLSTSTAKDGLSIITSHCPDVVLLDLGLPDMDGLDIIRQVRSWSSLPIIVISARTQEKEKVLALDLGADDYISKPFGNAELLARVRTVIRHSNKLNTNTPLYKRPYYAKGLKIDFEKYLLTINGEPIDPAKDYRITTIDYLLGGTDNMTAFKKCRNINSPQNAENNSRFVIMNYFREQTRLGREVDAKIEGRVTVKD